MQCNQPYWCNGFQNNTHYQYPSFPSYQIQTPYPEVIGQGDVMSFTLQDGSVQCYFVPINMRDRWIPYNTSYIPNSTPIWPNANNTAWFVRSISNAYPPLGCNQTISNNYPEPHTTSYVNVNPQSQDYVQKFHNDSCTSTSDLHYFCSRLRSPWLTNFCTGVQVEIPTQEKTIFHYGTVCNRPCYCCPQSSIQKTEPNGITERNSTETSMAVDEAKSTTLCCCKKEKSRSDVNMGKRNKNKSSVCQTRSKVNTSDKAVTTYAHKASSCTGKKECKSQTDIETETWYTKRPRNKNIERSSHRSLNACDSSCCLGSTCCCNSDHVIKK